MKSNLSVSLFAILTLINILSCRSVPSAADSKKNNQALFEKFAMRYYVFSDIEYRKDREWLNDKLNNFKGSIYFYADGEVSLIEGPHICSDGAPEAWGITEAGTAVLKCPKSKYKIEIEALNSENCRYDKRICKKLLPYAGKISVIKGTQIEPDASNGLISSIVVTADQRYFADMEPERLKQVAEVTAKDCRIFKTQYSQCVSRLKKKSDWPNVQEYAIGVGRGSGKFCGEYCSYWTICHSRGILKGSDEMCNDVCEKCSP